MAESDLGEGCFFGRHGAWKNAGPKPDTSRCVRYSQPTTWSLGLTSSGYCVVLRTRASYLSSCNKKSHACQHISSQRRDG
jgi:hypothetical protein